MFVRVYVCVCLWCVCCVCLCCVCVCGVCVVCVCVVCVCAVWCVCVCSVSEYFASDSIKVFSAEYYFSGLLEEECAG